ncbi:phage portal protein [Parabacteroides pacaensis]|uniref:phage portal protein n=1 Tax=Parabacteroides pacaensis TaxID=2086575 RepID=UPI000D114E23|nr:phage portal protein [Parabacteroides pacaensis]
MKTIEEILANEDIDRKIYYLKKGRKTQLPDRDKLYADWDPNKHEIFDEEKYPQIEVTIEQEKEVFDEKSGKTTVIPKKTKKVDPNRIALPLEQDIVNIQTAFTVGTEPKMDCSPAESEKGIFEALRQVLKKNKIKYQNRKIVRSWLSEQECAEYWYVTKDDGFWTKLKVKVANLFGKAMPQYKLRSVLWSPFRGDKLYPFFDDSGDMVAFSREYKKKDLDDHEITCFMTVTGDMVYQWELDKGWEMVTAFKHGFKKLPILYCYRPEAYCEKIKTIRVRLEKLLSSYADCIDYHFFPILKLFGEVEKFTGEFRNRVVQLTGENADAAYLTWNQASDPVKVEFENHFNQAYALTNTPRISFDQLKGSGNALSGVSFRYVFMGAHMAVENSAEEIGAFMQRRVNFLVSALGSINTNFEKASETIDVEVEIVPYMIDNIDDKVTTAVSAVSGGVWSRREGIMFAGNADRIDEELKEIEEQALQKKELKIEEKAAS